MDPVHAAIIRVVQRFTMKLNGGYMKRRLHWTALPSLAALTLTLVPVYAQGPAIAVGSGGAGSSPSQTYQPPARIPAPYSSNNPQVPAGTMALFEGPSVTDYFNFEQNFISPPNPQIAVGPDDILMIVNRQIFRVPNGNAAGVALPQTNGAVDDNPFRTGNPYAQKAFLDTWIGETAMNALCPSRNVVEADPAVCQIANPTVKYDQLHGRFLVLFTVVDTGLRNTGQGYALLADRKASWVLLVSRFAALTDSAQLPSASNQIFVTPTTPDTVTGGNAANWSLWYGSASDGFGGTHGNINSVPGVIDRAPNGNPFDCRSSAYQPAGTLPTSVCYFPTNARIGIDNDTVILSSAVYNGNINVANMSQTYNPEGCLLTANNGVQVPDCTNTDPSRVSTPAYAGNRVRVIKKSQLYTSPGAAGNPLTPGDQFDGIADQPAATAHYYDLYSNNLGTPWAAGTGVVPPVPFTLVVSNSAPQVGAAVTPGSKYASIPVVDHPPVPTLVEPSYLSPYFCEPQHLRGRPAATFSNALLPNSQGVSQSNAYLLCAISTPTATELSTFSHLFVQTLHHVQQTPAFPGSPILGPRPFIVHAANANALGTTAGTANIGWSGYPTAVPVNPHKNPADVAQLGNVRTTANGDSATRLFVGDNRPHKLVFREGHLYDARVISTQTTQFNFAGANSPLATTVAYDVIQRLAPTNQPLPVIFASWQNTRAYAPMFDVPANVSQVGQISPINVFPYLEKLFVATTHPPLVQSGLATDRRNWDRSSVTPAPLPPVANCFSNHTQPGLTSTSAWPSLFDMRCGEDPYESLFTVRDPATGLIRQATPFGIYGDSETDPNDGSLWNFGAYAKRKITTQAATSQWGTVAANYKMDFPLNDPYGNSYSVTVPSTHPFYNVIRIAGQLNIMPTSFITNSADAEEYVTRRNMAELVIRSMMDDAAVQNILNNTPQFGGPTQTSFADVPYSATGDWKYIEVMYRLGITRGCLATSDAVRRFCPDEKTTRREMAIFVVRAKLANVFPSVISGCPVGITNGTSTSTNVMWPAGVMTSCGSATGDNFHLFTTTLPYFVDNPIESSNDAYPFIQKARELRITIGRNLGPANNARNANYSPGPQISFDRPAAHEGFLKRGEIIAMMVRAFFF
ncbi:MAG: hypothetical protein IPM24_16065 [Bryobacterales bacterium]|nr:hypothetical protein [Bryobacterales bacterium]